MRRLLNEDPSMLRAKYLFDFAHICHMGPREVDALSYMDFLGLAQTIDAYKTEMSKPPEGGGL